MAPGAGAPFVSEGEHVSMTASRISLSLTNVAAGASPAQVHFIQGHTAAEVPQMAVRSLAVAKAHLTPGGRPGKKSGFF